MNLEFLHEFSCYGYIAKSLPGLIHSANQFIKFPYIIVLTFIMNEHRGLQPIYLAPNHHRSWWVMGGNASWWVMGSPPLVLMGDGRALEHLDGWWGLPCGGLVIWFISSYTPWKMSPMVAEVIPSPYIVAPEFVGRSQLKVKISHPKVGEICRGRIWSHFSYLVLAKWVNVRTCM